MAAYIFDFDGTIVDSFELVVSIFHELTGRTDKLPATEIERLRGMSLIRAAEELHLRPWKMPFLLMRGRRKMSKKLADIKPHEGLTEVIRKLHSEGHQMFVVSSNSSKNIKKFLRNHQLYNYFVGVYGGVGLLGKARALKKVLRKYNLEPKDCWYIGDEVRDIHGANEAGLPILAVTWGYNNTDILRKHKPTRLAANADELLKILENS